MLVRFAALSAALLWCSAAAATPETLAYEILRNGRPIGSHVLRFRDVRDGIEVDIRTDIVFTLLSLPVYRFTHRSTELWRDGRLFALSSDTDDNGERKRVQVERRDGALVLAGGGEAPPEAVPASLWHPATVGGAPLLDTLDGSVMTVAVEAAGADAIEAAGRNIPGHRFRLSGGLSREVWYADDGRLIGVRFTASDGSEIRYRLRGNQ